MKRIITIGVAILLCSVAVMVFGACTSSANGVAQENISTRPDGIVVEKTPNVEPVVKDSIVRMTNVEKQQLADILSCNQIKHEMVDGQTGDYSITHHDSHYVSLSCTASEDKKQIDVSISFIRPCKHAHHYTLTLEITPRIENWQNSGKPMNVLSILNNSGDDITLFDGATSGISTTTIQSDGKAHTIIPHFSCSYGMLSVKSDEFIGKPVTIK